MIADARAKDADVVETGQIPASATGRGIDNETTGPQQRATLDELPEPVGPVECTRKLNAK